MTTESPARLMTDDEFDRLIDTITANHKATLAAIIEGAPVPPPVELPAGIESQDDYKDLPQGALDAFATSRGNNENQANTNKDNVAPAADDYYHNVIPKDAFDDKIDKQINHNKDVFDHDQDQLGAKIKQVGHEQPSFQDKLVAALMDAGNYLVDKVWGAVKDFFGDLVKKIEQLWNTVVDWFSHTVNALGNFFHGLFG